MQVISSKQSSESTWNNDIIPSWGNDITSQLLNLAYHIGNLLIHTSQVSVFPRAQTALVTETFATTHISLTDRALPPPPPHAHIYILQASRRKSHILKIFKHKSAKNILLCKIARQEFSCPIQSACFC